MEEFVKELEQLPIERQKAIKEGLQKQILAQAVFVRDEQPTKFLAYIDDEIGKADASMFKMVQESSREGAVLGSISEIYIWNKERKKVLIGLKQEYLDITQADIEKQQQKPQQIPKELSTPEAKIYLDKAIELNLIDNGYKWRRNKQLLAYFAEQMSNRLNLSNKLDKDGKQTIAWKPFEILFGKTDLKGAKQNWMRINTKFEPTGFEEIDKIFL